MMNLPTYSPTGKCPKCNGEDVSTRYIKQGGKYGEPCEFYSADVRDTEHMHRHCRRCSYEWCEACATAAPTVEAPVQASTGTQRVTALRSTIEQLRQIGANWSDLMYTMEKHAAAYDLLLTRYAKFHTGDLVQLGCTPVINKTNAPGWLGSKHFLIIGARGTVRDVDMRDGVFYYQVVFDAESWLDDKKIERAVIPDNRHSYCMPEKYLVVLDA
jgi:hypothetical protein